MKINKNKRFSRKKYNNQLPMKTFTVFLTMTFVNGVYQVPKKRLVK